MLSPLAPIRHLRPLLAPYRRHIILFLLLGLTATLVEVLGIGLLIPMLQGATPQTESANLILQWLNEITSGIPEKNRVGTLTALIMAAMSAKALLAYAYTVQNRWLSSRVRRDTAQHLFSQLIRVSQSHLDQQPAGTLIHTLTTGPRDAGHSAQALLWLLLNVTTILIFSLLLTAIAWPLTLAALAVAVVVALLVRYTTRHLKSVSERSLNLEKTLTHLGKEGLNGIATIHAFGRESHEAENFNKAAERAHRQRRKSDALVALAHPLSELLGAALVIALVALALQIGMELSVLVAMAFMLYRLQPQLQGANSNLAAITAAQAPVEAVLELMDEHGKPYPRSGSIQPRRLTQGIRFESVGFAYEEREQTLNDIDCVIERGKITALVGRSGAGKSTLINLLCGFYEVSSGVIRIDNIALQELDLFAWRQKLALVSQDIHVFNTSVRENILYGRPEASEAEMVAAAKNAHAHDFISNLPQGYDTLVGDQGLRLSGGQRQRISIARAFLRDPEILILDEATNALDAVSEAYIQGALADLSRGRTLLVIAHRLSTIEHADHILVLDQGNLIEQGSFEQLLGADGQFAALYRNQQSDTRP